MLQKSLHQDVLGQVLQGLSVLECNSYVLCNNYFYVIPISLCLLLYIYVVFENKKKKKKKIEISLKFVLKGPINNIPALVQIMVWHRPGDKPLSDPMMVSLLRHSASMS